MHRQQQVVAGHYIGKFFVAAEVQIGKVTAFNAQLFQIGCLCQIQPGHLRIGAPQIQQRIVAGQRKGLQGTAQIQKVRQRLVLGYIQGRKRIVAACQFLQLCEGRYIQRCQTIIMAVQQLQRRNLRKIQIGQLIFIAQQTGQPRKLFQRQRNKRIANAVQVGKPGKTADAFQRSDSFIADIQTGHSLTLRPGKNTVAIGIHFADAVQKRHIGEMGIVQRNSPFSVGRFRGS